MTKGIRPSKLNIKLIYSENGGFLQKGKTFLLRLLIRMATISTVILFPQLQGE
jgi:hypothetical protein